MTEQRKVAWAGLAMAWFSPWAWAATHDFTTPGAHSFTVPAGVTTIQVDVAGAGGGAGSGVTVPNEFGMPLALVGCIQGAAAGPVPVCRRPWRWHRGM